MVAEQNLMYENQGLDSSDLDSRSSPNNMMLQDMKFFPGHPAHNSHIDGDHPFSPTFGQNKRDIFNQRKQREFIPENKKDEGYWDRRRRNNEAAKRSREKRRLNDMLLETRVIELSKDNHILRAQLNAVFEKYGIKGENMISMDVVMSTMPSNDQVLNFTKKRLGPLADLPREMSPPRLPFQSLGLPLSMNNNNIGSMNNNNCSTANNNNHDDSNNNSHNSNDGHNMSMRNCSPDRSLSPVHSRYRSPSPPQQFPLSQPKQMLGPAYPNLPQYNEELYRHSQQNHQFETEMEGQNKLSQEEDRHSDNDKDSGLALNLSTDRGSEGGHSRSDDSGRSSASLTPPVTSTSGHLQDTVSSGDESGYPRSPNGSSSSSGAPESARDQHGASMLPHKLRFKSAVSEKEAVSSLLSLHQMALIKQEPIDHINHWMESAGSGLHPHAGLLASLLPHSVPQRPQIQMEPEEPQRKRTKLGPANVPDKLTDEVARLTSEVATLKNILVNRMKDETEREAEDDLE